MHIINTVDAFPCRGYSTCNVRCAEKESVMIHIQRLAVGLLVLGSLAAGALAVLARVQEAFRLETLQDALGAVLLCGLILLIAYLLGMWLVWELKQKQHK